VAPRPTQSGASGDLGHPAQHDDASRAAQPSEGHAFHASGAHTAAGEQFPRVNGSSVSMAL